jgi:hypothetical protein
MAKPLTDTVIRTAKADFKSYKLSDSGGMYLIVKSDGAKYWRMDYRFAGKRRTLSIGVYPRVTLADARRAREEARALLTRGEDPGAAKRAAKKAAIAATVNSFEAVAGEWITNRRNGLSPKYAAQVSSL